ncbi:expressed unknown protein [Seminavis robusta]|uniref:Uncharacterized protein n=1 Tax=Seminavis robusta TaxID=568900 RepID=A0A9N8H5C8_9STRA|nr:expressed unknown protein [Seminavis robusta]|eukprot:Sro110_g055040.1 n/a (489) ;mRNA; r:95825-97291
MMARQGRDHVMVPSRGYPGVKREHVPVVRPTRQSSSNEFIELSSDSDQEEGPLDHPRPDKDVEPNTELPRNAIANNGATDDTAGVAQGIQLSSNNVIMEDASPPDTQLPNSGTVAPIAATPPPTANRKRPRGSAIDCISLPTKTERLFHGNNKVLAPWALKTYLYFQPQNRRELKIDNWALLPPEAKRLEEPLIVRISAKNKKRPVVIQYDQVELAKEKPNRYGIQLKKRKSSSSSKPTIITDHDDDDKTTTSKKPIQHVLLAAFARKENSIYNNNKNNETTATTTSDSPTPSSSQDNHDNSRMQLQEWFPNDPYETILNPTEQELAWLLEECRHCLGANNNNNSTNNTTTTPDKKDHQCNFIWEYASPSLKVELRALEDITDNNHLQSLIRWKEPLVAGRMDVVQRHIRQLLRNGFRRLHMKRVIAVLRLQTNYDVKKQGYPVPDFCNTKYQYHPQRHAVARNTSTTSSNSQQPREDNKKAPDENIN